MAAKKSRTDIVNRTVTCRVPDYHLSKLLELCSEYTYRVEWLKIRQLKNGDYSMSMNAHRTNFEYIEEDLESVALIGTIKIT